MGEKRKLSIADISMVVLAIIEIIRLLRELL